MAEQHGFVVSADAVYTLSDLQLGLNLTQATINAARRRGELQSFRTGHSVLFRGQWVLDWLEGRRASRSESEVRS